MATYSLTATPTQIDDGASYSVLVTNTGAAAVELSRGGRLRPNQSRTVYPEGTALTAAAVTGTGQVTTVATAAAQTQAQQVAANTSAIAGLPGTYASPAGAWSAGTYGINQVVTYNGSTYRSKINGNTATPGTDAAKWEAWGGGSGGSSTTISNLAHPARTSALLTIATPDGNVSVTHPSVVEAPTGSFNGYRYWMAATPYPADTRENPCVYASNDRVNWAAPVGLTNPVVPFSEVTALGYAYDSDPDLVFLDAGTLALFYRPASTTPSPKEAIYRKTSTDGVTWSTAAATNQVNGSSNNLLLAPSVCLLADGTTLAMYVVDASATTRVVRRRTSTDGGLTWGSATACTIPAGNNPWHIDINLVDGTYYLLSQDHDTNTVVFMESTDGVTFTGDTAWTLPKSGKGFDGRGYYRCTMLPASSYPGAPLRWDVWATAMDGSGADQFGALDVQRLILLENVDYKNATTTFRTDKALGVVSDRAMYTLADSFDRFSWNGIGNPDLGNAWTIASGAGGGVITSGKVRVTGAQTFLLTDCLTSFGTLTGYVTTPASGAMDNALILCCDSSGVANYLKVQVIRDSATYNRVRMFKQVAGTGTQLATNDTAGLAYSTTYRVDITLTSAGVFTCYLDSVSVLTYTLTSPELTTFTGKTRHGLFYNNDASTYWDDIRFKRERHA